MTKEVNRLIRELLEDPVRFYDSGKSYDLLKNYYEDCPLDTLRPLLSYDDIWVQRVAIWVASELGKSASILIHDIKPLIGTGDVYLEYHALEFIFLCTTDNHNGAFVHILYALENDNAVIRRLAMDLVCRANERQLLACTRILSINDKSNSYHLQGLFVLLEGQRVGATEITQMVQDKRALIRKYGAIIAQRNHSGLLESVLRRDVLNDVDLLEFSKAQSEKGSMQPSV